jgi:hypothetical protein
VRIDRTHQKWAMAAGALLLICGLVYFPYAVRTPNGPKGSSAIGLSYGILGFCLMFFAMLLGLRKKYPAWRIGRGQDWMRGHLWFGLISYPIILFHAGFSFGGSLTVVLMWIFTIVILSGIVGAAIQHFMPSVMTQRVPWETIYGQIDRVEQQLLQEADELVTAAAKIIPEPESKPEHFSGVMAGVKAEVEGLKELQHVYEAQIRPYLKVRGNYDHELAGRTNARYLFEQLRLISAHELYETIDDVKNICEEKRDLDRQSRLHRILHGWLFAHVPLSFVLIILSVIHAVMALRF